MSQVQTGQAQKADYYANLSRQLERTAVRSGLDTAETEVLMLWVSTVTEIPSLSICQARRMLMNGLKDFAWTMNNQALTDALMVAILQANSSVRYAAVIRRSGKPAKTIIYLAR